VDREYSRHSEEPKPWALSLLGEHPSQAEGQHHPFYSLSDFKLRHHQPLPFPHALKLSSNYFNPAWGGLRRIKNVIVVMEWTPDSDPENLRLLTDEEHETRSVLSPEQMAALSRAHELLSFHKGVDGRLTKEGLRDAVVASTDQNADDQVIDALVKEFGDARDGCLDAAGMSVCECLCLCIYESVYTCGGFW
jgi:hypothetical protein